MYLITQSMLAHRREGDYRRKRTVLRVLSNYLFTSSFFFPSYFLAGSSTHQGEGKKVRKWGEGRESGKCELGQWKVLALSPVIWSHVSYGTFNGLEFPWRRTSIYFQIMQWRRRRWKISTWNEPTERFIFSCLTLARLCCKGSWDCHSRGMTNAILICGLSSAHFCWFGSIKFQCFHLKAQPPEVDSFFT